MSAVLVFLINVLPLLLSSILMMPAPTPNPFPVGNTLIVTAHPDDEVMFFSTAVQALTREKHGEVWALCLSNGNAEGLGGQRAGELAKSYDILGVPQDHIILFGHPQLQDSISTEWDPEVVATVIKQVIGTHDINTILTFDEEGVSEHPNHASIAKSLPLLSSSPLSIYTLASHPALTKYTSVLPVLSPFTLLPQLHSAKEHIKVKGNWKTWWTAVKAMRQHESQMVWFRWLYLLGSRYLWTGEYVKVQ